MATEQEQTAEIINLLHNIASSREEFETGHSKEHEYLRYLIEEHKEKRDLRKEIRRKLATGTLWSVLVAIGGAVAYTVKSYFSGGGSL